MDTAIVKWRHIMIITHKVHIYDLDFYGCFDQIGLSLSYGPDAIGARCQRPNKYFIFSIFQDNKLYIQIQT